MDEPLARLTISTAARSARELGDLAPTLKVGCDAALHARVLHGIGSAIYEIYESVLGPVFAEFPDLKAEYDRDLDSFGRGD